MNMPLELATVRPSLVLRSLVADDGAAYAGLLSANTAHLTRHGDYTEAVRASAEEHAAGFAAADPLHNFGIYECGQLVGSVTLVPVDPPRFSLGYLLAEQACGRGIATLALPTTTSPAWQCCTVSASSGSRPSTPTTAITSTMPHMSRSPSVGSGSRCKTSYFQLFMGVPPRGDRGSPASGVAERYVAGRSSR